MKWAIRFGPTRIFGTTVEGGPLCLAWSFGSAGPKCSFDKIVVPSAPLSFCILCKYNNLTCSGLGWVCATQIYHSIGHMEFPKFQTGIFVEWKAPLVSGPEETGPVRLDVM